MPGCSSLLWQAYLLASSMLDLFLDSLLAKPPFTALETSGSRSLTLIFFVTLGAFAGAFFDMTGFPFLYVAGIEQAACLSAAFDSGMALLIASLILIKCTSIFYHCFGWCQTHRCTGDTQLYTIEKAATCPTLGKLFPG
jgi:hypothetical protein